MVEEVTKDVVYTALFEEIINYYNVTVKYNGELKQYKVKPGEVNTIPSITKEGYTFKGWSEDLTNLSCDIVVEPVFEINTYTLKYTLNGEHYIEKDYANASVNFIETDVFISLAFVIIRRTSDFYLPIYQKRRKDQFRENVRRTQEEADGRCDDACRLRCGDGRNG